MEIEKTVQEILDICEKKKIRVVYILKIKTNNVCKMDYFIAPPPEDMGGPCFWGCNGYSYNCKTKKIEKDSIPSPFFSYNKNDYYEVYRDKTL